ncbi:MAG TPA: lyase family protein, partial [Thermodesulfovibrionales bacterium]|nr:lyase family protein [Thermodesulfovibrionales bacterium]
MSGIFLPKGLPTSGSDRKRDILHNAGLNLFRKVDLIMKKLWSGRFTRGTAKIIEGFTESISFDRRLWKYDIEGSLAHAAMLGKQGIISKADSEKIGTGLREIAKEIERGTFRFREDLEDIHMNIEAALIKKIGETGGKLHTARSRNDQVAVDLRLYLRDETKKILTLIRKFQRTLLAIAEKHLA